MTSDGEDVEKVERLYTAGRTAKCLPPQPDTAKPSLALQEVPRAASSGFPFLHMEYHHQMRRCLGSLRILHVNLVEKKEQEEGEEEEGRKRRKKVRSVCSMEGWAKERGERRTRREVGKERRGRKGGTLAHIFAVLICLPGPSPRAALVLSPETWAKKCSFSCSCTPLWICCAQC